jgi:hypothetical protein
MQGEDVGGVTLVDSGIEDDADMEYHSGGFLLIIGCTRLLWFPVRATSHLRSIFGMLWCRSKFRFIPSMTISSSTEQR